MATGTLNTDCEPKVDSLEDTKETAESLVPDDPAQSELSSTDRFQQRLERFGKIAPEVKKMSRALRFGTSHENEEDDAKKRRSERFGLTTESAEDQDAKKRQRSDRFHVNNNLTAAVDEETKQKRIDRFGVVTPSTLTPLNNKPNTESVPTESVLTDAIKKRTERFGDISQIAKTNTLNEQKSKRAERFKTVPSV